MEEQHSAMHTETSDEVAGIANVTLDVESCSSLSLVQHLPRIWESPSRRCRMSVEAHHQTSMKTAEDLDEGPFPAYTSVRS